MQSYLRFSVTSDNKYKIVALNLYTTTIIGIYSTFDEAILMFQNAQCEEHRKFVESQFSELRNAMAFNPGPEQQD